VSAVAIDIAVGLEDQVRAVLTRPAVLEFEPVDEREPATGSDIDPWELHSELVLVCPDVCERARELLSERDPDAFLARPREPVLFDATHVAASLPTALFGYTLWQLVETAWCALVAVTAVVALALLADAFH
jgi:hypothetical protein